MGHNVKQVHISELEQDRANANKGSERGAYMLETSFREFGAGRSILIDKHGRIIAGNKSAEQAAALGLDDVIVVESDGTKLIAVQRTDLDLYEDARARKLAYADNRTSDFMTWDPEVLLADLQAGVDLSGLWFEHELDAVLGAFADDGEIDPSQEWRGMPEFEQENLQGLIVRVHFANETDRAKFFTMLGVKFTDKTNSIWYPERPEELKNQLGNGMVYTDES